MSATSSKLGRLGNPDLTLATDPRADPRLVMALVSKSLGAHPKQPPLRADAPYPHLLRFAAAIEPSLEALAATLCASVPTSAAIHRQTEVIAGIDSNEITLHIHRPRKMTGLLPCVLHSHGGGMTLLRATNHNYVRWRDALAASGLIVVGVEFRNAAGKLGPHPFPAGLNDCASALHWVHANRLALQLGKIILSGESGGANLALANALQAKREGYLAMIDGVYAQCPYISGHYADKLDSLPSLIENDDYFISCSMMSILKRLYSPDGSADQNPLAWPFLAQTAQLRHLPPHVISVNELDPLRDEGLAYFDNLQAASVSATNRIVNASCHAADCLFHDAMPDVYQTSVRDIANFAYSL